MFSDDLEMKAISAALRRRRRRRSQAIAAGCDAVLMCGPSQETQIAALEGADPRGRGRNAAAEAGRGRAGAPAARQGTIPCRRRSPSRCRSGAARRARPRRASGDCRRDGALRLACAVTSPCPITSRFRPHPPDLSLCCRRRTIARGARSVMRKPRALRPGDRIAIVAPASPFARDEFDAGLAELRALGFEPVYDETVFARRATSPVRRRCARRPSCGRGPIRRSPRSIAARGGYGSVQLLPLLDRGRHRAGTPKAFIGYSDNTSILAWLTTQLRRGRVPRADARRPPRARRGRLRSRHVSRAACAWPSRWARSSHPQLEALRPGEAAGMLVGGTLTQLLASLGTPYAFDPPPGACCSSTKSASGPTGSIAC